MYQIAKIKEDFKKVIQYSQKIEEPKMIDELFKKWFQEKSKRKDRYRQRLFHG